jgi:periplasmic divalent cation tolerance protein
VTGAVLVLSAVGSLEEADRIAQALVGERLAACVNVVPGVLSTYRWQGAVQREEELLLVIKTRAEKVDDLRARVVALHSYELPEVVVVAISDGHRPYLDWIAENVDP